MPEKWLKNAKNVKFIKKYVEHKYSYIFKFGSHGVISTEKLTLNLYNTSTQIHCTYV